MTRMVAAGDRNVQGANAKPDRTIPHISWGWWHPARSWWPRSRSRHIQVPVRMSQFHRTPLAMVFVLVHSPLVGPGTWSPVARELGRRGRQAVVPSLLGPAGAPPRHWRHCVEAARDAVISLSDPIILVGHSGGGLLLPIIADAVAPPVSSLIFVDSGLPASTGETPLAPPPFLDHLRTLAVGGMLPPWSTWWGEEAMRDLVPNGALRTALAREMPSLPLAFFEHGIPSPAGWDRTPCAYLLLSDAYREAATEARERGWRVEEIAGAQHLHVAVAPEAVTDALLELAVT
jgi:pimeloyl-ACP methyl ester carboxylesterase